MKLTINCSLAITLPQPASLLFQIEAAQMARQRVQTERLTSDIDAPQSLVAGYDAIGTRRWIAASAGVHHLHYKGEIDIVRQTTPLAALKPVALVDLPSEATHYLFESRYCRMAQLAGEIDGLLGPADRRLTAAAICEWLAGNISYQGNSSTSETTAEDVLASRRGVCRDFAHLAIAMARACDIPARYASGYGPQVVPQDFHAVAQLWLADESGVAGWHIVDGTGMADNSDFAIISVGRDAADCSFLSIFGEGADSSHEINVVAAG